MGRGNGTYVQSEERRVQCSPLGGRGWASLRVAPTTLESEVQRKIRETGSSKHPFLRLLDQTSDCSAVGACRRPALPRPPGGQILLLTVITYVDLMRNKEITSVVHWRRQLQPGSNMPAGDFFVYIKNNTL